MKEQITIQIKDKQYPLYLTIGDLRMLERGIGHSVLSIISGNTVDDAVSYIMTDELVELIRWGIHDDKHGKRTDDECYDFLQAYCDGGHNYDEATALFIRAVWNTGLFVPLPGLKPKNVRTAGQKK